MRFWGKLLSRALFVVALSLQASISISASGDLPKSEEAVIQVRDHLFDFQMKVPSDFFLDPVVVPNDVTGGDSLIVDSGAYDGESVSVTVDTLPANTTLDEWFKGKLKNFKGFAGVTPETLQLVGARRGLWVQYSGPPTLGELAPDPSSVQGIGVGVVELNNQIIVFQATAFRISSSFTLERLKEYKSSFNAAHLGPPGTNPPLPEPRVAPKDDPTIQNQRL